MRVLELLLAAVLLHTTAAFLPSGTPGSTAAQRRHGDIVVHSTIADQSEFARAELARKQKEYDASLKQRMMEQAKTSSADTAPQLADLPKVPFLTEQGTISDSGVTSKVKASVYAISNANHEVVFIGVSRNVAQSLRLHLARAPDQTYFFQVFHITKPSRVLLEITRDAWVNQLGYTPVGNDQGPVQAAWEGPMDVKPLMTAEDHALIEAAREKQRPEEGAIKKIARRFEAEKVKILEARGVTESLRFDPKLKAQGLLDLYMEKPKDEVPQEKPK